MSKSVATKAPIESSKIQMMFVFSFSLVCGISIAVFLVILSVIVFILFWKTASSSLRINKITARAVLQTFHVIVVRVF